VSSASDPERSTQAERLNRSGAFRLFLVLVLAGMAALGWASLSLHDQAAGDESRSLATLVALATEVNKSPSPAAATIAASPSVTSSPPATREGPLGTIVYAARQGAYSHLWAVLPGESTGTLLTNGEYDDRDPSVGPDEKTVAFASNRDGAWDLYALDLLNGETRRLTQTAGFDGHPTWSPDGRWIAYDSYSGSDYDIWILSTDGSQAPIQLTNHPAKDINPTWDPGSGRRIVFMSDRDGSEDLFMAALDRPEDRFTNLTHSAELDETDPAFSPDGSRLVYSTNVGGVESLRSIDMENPEHPAVQIGQGRAPAWSPDGTMIVAELVSPQGARLVGYGFDGTTLTPVSVSQPGEGLRASWSKGGYAVLTQAYPDEGEEGVRLPDTATPERLSGRLSLVDLRGVNAPNATLVGGADEAFQSLREAVASRVGWDFLGRLDHAFVGLNDPLPPGFAYNDWLYTGRAFSVTKEAANAGWLYAVREDLVGQTYWRLYVRTNKQDGSEGEPLRRHPWDFSARFDGDPNHYDQGGAPMKDLPTGYFVDFSSLAAAYGFERQPALPNWRTFYEGARFDEFAYTQGLDWVTAMLQLYPASAIATPTRYSTPTVTPTRTPWPTPTPWWWRWRTPTASPTAPATPPAIPSAP
jgi:TolB protein